MQLTNIARDVREDSQRGRCYIPKSWLPRGVDGSSQDEIRVAVRRLLDLADEHYKIGYEGLGYLPVKVRPAIRVAAAVYREIGVQIRRRDYQVLRGRIVTPKLRFVIVAVTTWSRGVVRDLKEIAKSFKRDQTDPNRFPVSKDFIVNDAKYLCYLGISLTAFMSSALFLLVMLNPKDASYATLPLAYAAACFTVGLLANLLAKRSETPVPVRVAAEDSTERQQVDVMARRVRSKNR
jgi:phytoene synthase